MSEPIEITGSIDRTLRAFQSIAERGDFSPKDLAEDIGIPVSTAYRLLQSFAAADYVEKTAQGSYRPGRQLLRLSSLIVDRFDYEALTQPVLAELSARFGETCAFALYLPRDHALTIVNAIQADHPLQYVVQKFTPRPMVHGALGRSMLPFLPEEDVLAAVEKQGEPDNGHHAITRAELAAEAEQIHRQGCFVATSPNAYGTNGTAAPVFNSKGHVLGSVGVTVPIVRYDPAIQPAIIEAVVEAARGLSEILGHGTRSATASKG